MRAFSIFVKSASVLEKGLLNSTGMFGSINVLADNTLEPFRLLTQIINVTNAFEAFKTSCLE